MGQKICQEIFAITSDNRINIRENEITIRIIIITFIQRRKAIISATNGLNIRKKKLIEFVANHIRKKYIWRCLVRWNKFKLQNLSQYTEN